jgi:cytochrome c oxidase subunit 2
MLTFLINYLNYRTFKLRVGSQLIFPSFQDSASPIMEGIVNLHNYIFFYLVVVLIFVLFMLYNILMVYFYYVNSPSNADELLFRYVVLKNLKIVHGTWLEIIWTLLPSLILVLIAIPSFALLYSMDEIINPSLTLKVIGYQWYWAYEYSDYNTRTRNSIAFDSYMIDENDLKKGDLRLLEVDNEAVLPVNTHIRVLLTAGDVLHSWAVPSLGVKTDAVPGRLNQIPMFIKRQGVYYGQCSELCGVNHGFTPIVIKACSLDSYLNWLTNNFNSARNK